MKRPYAAGAATSLLFAVLVLGSSCATPPPPPASGASGRIFAAWTPGTPLENFAKMTPAIWRGAQPDATGLRYLKEQGCRTVLNFRSHHSEKEEAEAFGLKVVELPLHADVFGSSAPTDDEIRRFFSIVLDPAAQPVYIHCAHGKDRTGTMAALYRIEVDGWTNEEAVEELLAFGYHTIYKDLIVFVKAYKPIGVAKTDVRR